MWTKAITQKMSDEGIGQIGSFVFRHFMPADVKRGVMVAPPLVGMNRDQELPGFRKCSIQIIVREKTHEAAETLSAQVIAALKVTEEEVWPVGSESVTVRRFHARAEPVIFPRTQAGHIEASINFEAVVYLPDNLA